jgi:hypothetical protein
MKVRNFRAVIYMATAPHAPINFCSNRSFIIEAWIHDLRAIPPLHNTPTDQVQANGGDKTTMVARRSDTVSRSQHSLRPRETWLTGREEVSTITRISAIRRPTTPPTSRLAQIRKIKTRLFREKRRALVLARHDHSLTIPPTPPLIESPRLPLPQS